MLVSCAIGLVQAPDCRAQDVVELEHNGRTYIGKALAWDGDDALLMRRDGRMSVVPADEESDFKRVDGDFEPLSKEVIRTRLQREFGGKYQVSMTANFVVVHPKGPHTKWAQPFETLYTRFRAYFITRGTALGEPEFPMVAIVLRTRGEFDRFLQLYHHYDPDILGYYSPRSNRVVTYDQSGGDSSSQDWFFNTDTIIHEATHQTAFNTGIHTRVGEVPNWISEGLATMFEAPGVNNSLHHSRQEDRINRGRLMNLKDFYRDDKVDEQLATLVSNDQLFRSDPTLAYAVSWGLTFYLAENYPQDYHRYLREEAGRDDYERYDSAQRVESFAKFFEEDFDVLAARMRRFYADLRVPRR